MKHHTQIHLGKERAPNMLSKARQSEIVRGHVEEFLRRGGKITVLEMGETGAVISKVPRQMARNLMRAEVTQVNERHAPE